MARVIAEIDLQQVDCVEAGQGDFVWIGLHEPDESLLRIVQQRFKLHDLAVEDAHTAHQRPKLEVYGDSLFVVVRTAHLTDGKIGWGETHIFAGRGYVVTVRHGSTIAYNTVRARCESAPEMLSMGESFVIYSVMDFIVDNYFPVLHELEVEVDALEDAVFSPHTARLDIERVFELRHELLLMRRAVLPLQEVCNNLIRFDVTLIAPTMRPYFRDVQDHVIRVVESIDNLRELLKGALEANLLLASVQQNDVTKKLAAWAAILAVPTAVAGVYGMNFKYMPELEYPAAYPVVPTVIAALCGYCITALSAQGGYKRLRFAVLSIAARMRSCCHGRRTFAAEGGSRSRGRQGGSMLVSTRLRPAHDSAIEIEPSYFSVREFGFPVADRSGTSPAGRAG